MNCSRCGEICHCQSEPPSPAPGETHSSTWREELSARLNRYRSRRKIRPPRYASLRLQFEMPEAPETPASSGGFDVVSDQALALDGMRPTTAPEEGAGPESSHDARTRAAVPSSGAKILEFPRFNWAEPASTFDQLAEPVVTRPRILEVPEVTPPPPALGGITIDASEHDESGKQLSIDVPLQGVSLARRIFAGAIDGLIVAAAAALFGVIFWKVTAVPPPQIQILVLAAGIPCLLWAGYQYLLVVYAGGTPGLRLAGLRLARFDNSPTTRSLRRWRVLASYLSAASLGMGFAWALLDQDGLCWHDRITHTYLAGKNALKRGS